MSRFGLIAVTPKPFFVVGEFTAWRDGASGPVSRPAGL